MEENDFPDLKMTPMQQVMGHLVEMIEGLKQAGLSEKSAVRFAAYVFAEQSGGDAEPDA